MNEINLNEPPSTSSDSNRVYSSLEEAAQARLEAQKAGRSIYGNFRLHLAHPHDDNLWIGAYRSFAKAGGWWNTPYLEIYNDKRVAPLDPPIDLISSLRLGQTPAEFYATIDSVLQETGVDLEEVKRLRGINDVARLEELYKDAFDKLRTMYTNYDLTT